MRFIAIFIGILLWGARAGADERPILQLDSGGHTALIRGLAFTPDSKFIVSAGEDKVIRVWDWRKGVTVRTIRGQSEPGNEGKIYAVALSPDGRWLAVGGWMHPECAGRCGDIRLYNFASGELKALLEGHRNKVLGLAFSPDSRKLISGGGDFNAIIWDVGEAKPLRRLEGHRGDIYAVGFTPDGLRAVTGSEDNTLRLWQVADGALLKEMTGHREKIFSLAVSPRDGSIASGGDSGEIRLWDGKTGASLKVLTQQDYSVASLRFSPDGRLLLSTCGYEGCELTQRIYDVSSGKELTAYTKHDNSVIASAFSPNGGLVATGGGDPFSIQVWDPQTGETKAVLKGAGRSSWAAGFSGDGRSIAWGNTRERDDPIDRGPFEIALRLPAADTALAQPEPITSQEGWVRAKTAFGALSLDRRSGGAFGYDDAILDILKDGKPTGVHIERGKVDGYGHRAYSFTPDGKQIISGGSDGVLAAYDLDGKKIGEFIGHESDVWAVAASPDGHYLVSGSGDLTVRLWNLKTCELLVTLFRGRDGEWVMWTPEGFYARSKGGAKILGWQLNRGPDKEARYVSADVEQLRKTLFRPDLVAAKIAGDPQGLVKAAALNIDELIARALAPEVAILSPADGVRLSEANVAITVRVTDRGGGIGNVIFKLNGQRVRSVYGAGSFTESFDLASADTRIEVTAQDESGEEGPPALLTVHADPRVLQGAPDLYVLAIGVNRYLDTNSKLNYAVNDALVLSDTLKEAGASFYRHPPIVKTLFDYEVTAEKVGALFKELGGLVKATDVFVFYMAGHGRTIVTRNGNTIQRYYYFLPPAMDRFSDEAIKSGGFGPKIFPQWFEKIKAEKSIWIFDTCESASADIYLGVPDRERAGDESAYQAMKNATGRAIWMAGGENQPAREGYHNHGIFTYALLKGIAEAVDGGNVKLTDLEGYVEKEVPRLSALKKWCDAKSPNEKCQVPKMDRLGNDYPLVPRYRAILDKLGADEPEIGTKPTHVVLRDTNLFDASNRGAPVKRQLRHGEAVTLIKAENGWAHIAKDGTPLGYVEEDKLLEIIRD